MYQNLHVFFNVELGVTSHLVKLSLIVLNNKYTDIVVLVDQKQLFWPMLYM